MYYQDYLKKTSKRFKDRFDEIDPKWNYDQGNEFEIELTSLLDEMLPDKYGVCRGFVTPLVGESHGDDIVIYDKMSAPLMRPQNQYKFTRKENVPLESVYAYIEAKNTIELKIKSKGTYLLKAVNQTKSIKKMGREAREFDEIVSGIKVKKNVEVFGHKFANLDRFNPLFTVVFARGARARGNIIKNPYKIRDYLIEFDLGNNSPDLIIIGNDIACFPTMDDLYLGPFCVNDRSNLTVSIMPGLAYGFGLTSLIYALQKIKLKQVQWLKLMDEAIKIGNLNSQK